MAHPVAHLVAPSASSPHSVHTPGRSISRARPRPGRNEELAEFAKHRLDSRLHATPTSRRRAVQWRRQQTPGMREVEGGKFGR